MALIVTGDDDDIIHASTHGLMSRDDVSYFRERVERAARTATGLASKYLNNARESLKNFSLSGLKDRVDAMRDRFTHRWDEDRIQELVTLQDQQQAKPTMRKLLMADPRARNLFYAGRISGWEGDFEDEWAGWTAGETPLYRQLMNGAYDDSAPDEDRWVTKLGAADEIYGDEEYSHHEKVAVRRSWRAQRAEFDNGQQDPTSHLRKTL